MRIRTIKPSFYKDEELAELHPLIRILFIGLWGLADKEGRLEDRPKYIKAEILPYDDCDICAFLDVLVEDEYIQRYAIEDKKYIQVLTFKRHQRISGKEAEMTSEIPEPPPFLRRREAPGKHPGSTREALETAGREGKGKEGNKEMITPIIPFKGDVQIPEDLKDSETEIKKWLAYKKEKGQTYKSQGLDALFGRIRKIESDARKEAIEQSMANNYSGIFPPKGDYNAAKIKSGATPITGKYAHLG